MRKTPLRRTKSLAPVSAQKRKRSGVVKPLAIKIHGDGREVCNLDTRNGYVEYKNRTQQMLIRQGRICCLHGYAPMCSGAMSERDATFEHENGKGMGGAKRDDRIELPDGSRINGAAHSICNAWKGSRFIDYNRRKESAA